MPLEKRKALVTVVLLVFGVLIEWFYINYMFASGLRDATVELRFIQGNFHLVVLPAVGALSVFLASWTSIGERILLGRGRPELRSLSTWLRTAKAASLVAAAFVSALFLPYVLWSSWLWGLLGKLTTLIPQTTTSLVGLYEGTAKIWELGSLWKYVASQNVSALFTATVAVIYIRRATGIKRSK